MVVAGTKKTCSGTAKAGLQLGGVAVIGSVGLDRAARGLIWPLLLSRTNLTPDDGSEPITERLVSISSFFKVSMLVINPVCPVAGQLIQATLSQVVIKTKFAELRSGRAAKIVDAALVE